MPPLSLCALGAGVALGYIYRQDIAVTDGCTN
jgi:hypothetical protein